MGKRKETDFAWSWHSISRNKGCGLFKSSSRSFHILCKNKELDRQRPWVKTNVCKSWSQENWGLWLSPLCRKIKIVVNTSGLEEGSSCAHSPPPLMWPGSVGFHAQFPLQGCELWSWESEKHQERHRERLNRWCMGQSSCHPSMGTWVWIPRTHVKSDIVEKGWNSSTLWHRGRER